MVRIIVQKINADGGIENYIVVADCAKVKVTKPVVDQIKAQVKALVKQEAA